ncbi:hypothetical protein AX15_001084 [Amanita polypyramis BW_CC]|nr:hypothetical protein AX15_001084 [Amanita polypyramis BW_CC]
MGFANLALASAREAFPELPPEVWQKIFHMAVQLPGAYSHTDVDGFVAFTRDQYGVCAQTRFKAVMSTKLSISLVCSTWNALITRHMFEYVLVESGPQTLRIADAFARHASVINNYNKRSRPAWWTVRLELALDPAHTWTQEHSLALAYIIKGCPNLTCFSTAFCVGDPPPLDNSPILAALAESPSVKRVELKTDIPSLKLIASSLSQSLEMVWVRPSRRACEDQDPWACSLPNLHTFVSHFQFGRVLDHLDLPSLDTVIVNDTCDRSSIINKSGSHLQYLSVSDIAITLPLLPLCQNLVTLAVNFHEVTLRNFTLIFKTMRLSNVERLVIEGNSDIDLSWWFTAKPARHSECLRKNLTSLASAETFPNLRSVRLVLPLCVEKIVQDPDARCNWRCIWSSWFTACNERGIAVETAYDSQEWSTNEWQPFQISL